jgi:ribosome biogenesis GTPase A
VTPSNGLHARRVLRTKHIDDGIESLEQITEAINSGNENIKERYMKNRDKENITGNINDNVSRGTNDGKLWNGKCICAVNGLCDLF